MRETEKLKKNLIQERNKHQIAEVVLYECLIIDEQELLIIMIHKQ